MYPTDLTVAAVVAARRASILLVEERAMGQIVSSASLAAISRPANLLRTGRRFGRTLEETGCTVVLRMTSMGVYLWIHPQTRQQFLRSRLRRNASSSCDEALPLDDGYPVARHWMDRCRTSKSRRSRLAIPCGPALRSRLRRRTIVKV